MQDARSLKRIGKCETRTMGPAARPVTIAARQMTIVYVLIVSTFEPLLKVIIALCKHISNLAFFSAWLAIQERNLSGRSY